MAYCWGSAIDGTSTLENLGMVKNGKGTFTYADGATYFGIFKNGKEHGQELLLAGTIYWRI